jgi:hypothetical protein
MGIVVAVSLMQLPLRASEVDKKTYLTFNESVQIPGQVLDAGTYVIKRADPENPNILQITSEDELHVFDTVSTIPVQRPKPTESVELRLAETPGGAPRAVESWFYPGELTGQAFIYGDDQPVLMASNDSRRLQVRSEDEGAIAGMDAPAADDARDESELSPMASSAESEPQLMAQAQPPQSQSSGQAASQQSSQGSAQTPGQLPATAGFLTLFGLAGAGALAGGLGIQAILRRRRQ